MRDSGQPEQDRILRSMELHTVDEEVDVTPAIMQKVRLIHRKKHGRNDGNRKKTLMIAMLTAILILSSLSVYASHYLIQIKNKEGEVILSTIKPWKYSESEYNAERVKETEEELRKRLKPGEQAVFYIKDLHMTPLIKEQPLKYFYMLTKHSNYQELAKEIEEKNAPVLLEPDYVPEGYRFDYGQIQIRNEPVWGTPEYETLLNELKEQAEQSDEEQGLFYKIVPWFQIASTGMEYRKGENRIKMVAFAREKGSKAGVPTNQAVKIKVKGKEMILSASPSSPSRSLTWLSDSEEVLYIITDDPKDPLSKDEFAKIAAGLIP
ncbi:hypothetical protein MHI43_13460 [Paenibacillus sp. FSL H8-0457]|uniref:hypothetical protein n=1 Tax=unclassified Paenibacillus TaxID=185978 RepID=UPI0003E201F7|nr:hypothetical protein [Paenibacillus sp. FSL H8-457]ETT62451.1 hypothetical protein C172_18526 [Paenibacillus sp. FSL H8-457]